MAPVTQHALTLDSNIIISYLNDDPKIVNQLLEWKRENKRFFISVVTEIEVLSLPGLTEEEVFKIRRFLQEFTVIPLDTQLGRVAAEIRRNLKINLGDSIIVATAEFTNSILVTQDKDIIKNAKSRIRPLSIK